MVQQPTVSYPRSPSVELQALLMPEEFLAPLIGLNTRKVCGTELDVHLRVGDEVQVYCGRTRILTVQQLLQPAGCVNVKAYDTYLKQPSAKASGLFKRWETGERGFNESIEAYLSGVEVNSSLLKGEGAVQSNWSQITEPWIPFDREAVLKYESTEHRREDAKEFAKLESAIDAIKSKARQHNWPKPNRGAREVDQLAIDPNGCLVLIELKDASAKAADKVYYAPLQLLQYVWEWHNALEMVRDDLQKLIEARVAVGLTPPKVPTLTGGIRAAVGFGPDCRTPEVKCRYNTVLKIVSQHLPPGMAAIETWEHTVHGPRQVAQE